MSQVKQLLDNLLADIYGRQQRQQSTASRRRRTRCGRINMQHRRPELSSHWLLSQRSADEWQRMRIGRLIDVCAILKVELQLMGFCLERALIDRDRLRRHQDILCEFVDAILYVEYLCVLHGYYDTQPKMRFSLSPPPPKAVAAASVTATTNATSPTIANASTVAFSNFIGMQDNARKANRSGSSATANVFVARQRAAAKSAENLAALTAGTPAPSTTVRMASGMTAEDAEAASDYIQWLHAMKLVARLPGGMPPEFRRKLWLSLADKYLKSRKVDWAKEEEKCFCEEWREDDEELGIQIVKDLHRTGSNLCTGPAGSINQAKLKRILLGYARYNPEVGYCQGFNMLGALILQVMDKEEIESMKVMIYLVEGVLPTGYFCGSMGGLQADMGVFRELMQTKLPRLAKHLQKLQGPIENAYEPPLTNVFTMQWFLTLFCTCLPMSCVLRVWDLILIEGSDVLLRTALVLWSLLEERVLNARTADDFYGKMGSFSNELLNGHLIDSNGLIEKVVELGPIPDIQKLRDKHLYNIAPLRHKQGLDLYFDDEEPGLDEESRLAVATVWGIPWGRRGSQPVGAKASSENKDRIALDISLLKKQYDRLRERQKQAHIILSTACSTTARQASITVAPSMPINQLLLGRTAIVSSKGRRPPPLGSIPPARKPSLPTLLHAKPQLAERQQHVLRRGETLLWRDTDDTTNRKRRDSLTWKEIKADRATLLREGGPPAGQPAKLRTRMGKSDSSSYSEDSDDDDDDGDNGSSTDTSLCDDDDDPASASSNKLRASKAEKSPKRRTKASRKHKDIAVKLLRLNEARESQHDRRRPKSWAPSSNEIPFTLMTAEASPVHSDGAEREAATARIPEYEQHTMREEEDSATESDRIMGGKAVKALDWPNTKYSPIAGDLATSVKLPPLLIQTDLLDMSHITSTSQLSPMPDIVSYLSSSAISPLPTPKPQFLNSTNSLGSDDTKKYDVNDDGVTNEYFERVNSVERPNKLELSFSLNEEDGMRDVVYKPDDADDPGKTDDIAYAPVLATDDLTKSELPSAPSAGHRPTHHAEDYEDSSKRSRRLELLMNYSEKSSAAFIAEATSELSSNFKREKTKDDAAVLQMLADADSVPPKRDDEVPGRDCVDSYCEVVYRRTPVSKEQATLNATLKRRDPRRLTLTRSSTIDIEERFQALEKRLSADAMETPKHAASEHQARVLKDSHETLKKIPSTADLEERFHCLEKQLSIDKSGSQKPTDAYRLSHRESFDSGVPISDMSDSENVPQKKPTHESTSTVSQLERQMSSKGSSSTNPNDLKRSPERESNKKPEKLEKKLRESQDDESCSKDKPKTANEADSSDDKKHPVQKEPTKARLTKLPSTAELEDRFDALEREKTAQKESPSQHPKEPPDATKPEQNQCKEVKKDTVQDEEKLKASPCDSKNDEEKKVVQASEKDDGTTRKKTPPSMEELEKRFNALEKQLSRPVLEITDKIPVKKEESATKVSKSEAGDGSEKQKSNITTKDETLKADKGKNIKETDSQPETKTPTHENATSSKKSPHNGSDTEVKKCEEESLDGALSVESDKATGKRRASEPPSTEDLEKRYETLKRRMSSNTKTITERSLSHSETVEEAMERIEKEITENDVKVNPNNEQEKCEKVEIKTENNVEKQSKSSSPPTTEDLESRYDALHSKTTAREDGKPDIASDSTAKKTPSPEKAKSKRPPSLSAATADQLKSQRTSSDSSNIPHAPPMPPEFVVDTPQGGASRRAVIEELESKMKTQPPSNENLKPSDINPTRRSPTPIRRSEATPKIDVPSEAHAAEALYKSESYEHWRQQSTQPVRRFSDLPSRCDLENRLQFLEKQLSKKFYKLRRVSDSEVTSNRPTQQKPILLATTSNTVKTQSTSEEELEKRVQMLEKQLSENSLKLVEAMQRRDHDRSPSSRRISTDTIDATGKELVRYHTLSGELEPGDSEAHKPINISINIKMRLNNESESKKASPTATMTSLPTTEELGKRLEMLEEQLRLLHVDKPTEHTERSEENVEPIATPASCAGEGQCPPEPPTEEENPDALEATAVVEDTSDNMETGDIREASLSADQPKEEAEEQHNEVTEEDKIDTSKEVEEPEQLPKEEQLKDNKGPEEDSTGPPKAENMTVSDETVGPTDPNNKTLVLLLDNEPKAVKVRRLTRANTEELEGLFQALEKQLNDRNLIKSADGRLRRANTEPELAQSNGNDSANPTEESKAISDLTKEIEQFTSDSKHNGKSVREPAARSPEKAEEKEEEYDWGPDFTKWHLRRKTVYLPSTKELEARFRSLERQIKLLEDVEKIDVEHRLNEIERKIKLQYSLSHEKDLSKYLELCEGKGLDDGPEEGKKLETESPRRTQLAGAQSTTPTAAKKVTIPCSSPTRSRETQCCTRSGGRRSPYTSPGRHERTRDRSTSPSQYADRKSPSRSCCKSLCNCNHADFHSPEPCSRASKSPCQTPSHASRHGLYKSPVRQGREEDASVPTTDGLECRYHSLEHTKSKSKENIAGKAAKKTPDKQPIHRLEMLLDDSPVKEPIPTTGELEHRMRVLDRSRRHTPSPPIRKSRSHSPTIEEIKMRKMLMEPPSPTKREPPTADELDARMRALERDQCFNSNTQKTFETFNRKLKSVVSPTMSFDEFMASKSAKPATTSEEPRSYKSTISATTSSSMPKSAMSGGAIPKREYGTSSEFEPRSISPKMIHFKEPEEYRPRSRTDMREARHTEGSGGALHSMEENSKMLHRILQNTITDSPSYKGGSSASLSEGVDVLGSRLMRETSPLLRKGTHTGVPLRTDDNINERLTSIKNTIKSIDTLCEEKPYHKEKCQRYIDSLFADSTHFKKKASLEDVRVREYTPAIRVSDHSLLNKATDRQQQPQTQSLLSRSMGSAESIRSISPRRGTSPMRYRSNRDLQRDV